MRFIVAGYGKFGRLAFERLRRKGCAHHITVIDPFKDLTHIEGLHGVKGISADAVSFLSAGGVAPDAIVLPMTPFHLAARYLQAVTPNLIEDQIPQRITARLPNAFRLSRGVVCFSLAAHLCPDDCEEADVCAVTGESRNPPLYERLQILPGLDRPLTVLRSAQILPGLGGYCFRELSALAMGNDQPTRLVATSCRCHGIMTALTTVR